IHASDLRSRTGATGTGVRIGVITRGLGDIDAATRSGDLPGPPDPASTSYPSLQVLNQGDNTSGSGLAVLEVLHDVAPEAQLIYHGAETELDYLLAMRAMGDAGIQIVVTNVSFPRDPTFSDGPAAAAAKDLVDSGVLVIAAAGEHGQSQVQQTASPVQVQDRVLHQFQLGDGDAGSVIAVRSRVPGTQQLGLHWRSLGDAIAQDAAAIPRLVKVDYSEVDQHILSIDSDGQIDPIRPYMVSTVDADQAGEVHYFAIELPDASTPFELEIVGSGGLEFVNLPLSLVGGDSISGPAAVPGVVTVGSVDVNTPHMRLPESSRGPSTIDGERRSSLDVMAPTNVRVFGNGQSDFASGTGVAAAHVAAGAALLWDLINRLGRNSAETPAEIRDALRSTASRANDPGNDEGYGLININAAASALNLQISDSPFQPIIYSTLERLARQGVIVNVDTDSLRGFLSGESPPVPILQVSVDRQAFDNGTLRGAFEFDLGRDVLGSLGDLSFQGQMEGRLEPAALLQFGFDVGGLYLDSNSWVGGRITLQPQLDAMWHSSEVSLQGEIVAVPRLGFADGSPRVRLSSLSESFANLEVGLLPIENSQPTTLRGSLDVGVTFGFLDYVDADPFTPNSENGGDPFQLKIETGIESDAAAIGFDDLVGAAWDWTEFRLLNPDVDGNGEEDFTTGVFLENIFQFGTDLLQGSGIGDYLRDILGAFGADDLIPFQPRPLGMLPESVPPTPEADSARARIEAGLNSLSGTALQSEVDSALYDWFYGGSSSSSAEGENTGLSILGRLQRLNPFSDDFDSSLNIDGFRESIVEALGDVRRFMSTALTLRGAGDENLIELLGDTAISVARDHMTKALSRAIQQAHDETIRLYHSDAPARRNEQGPGYIDRAVDMYRWSQTAELMGLGGEGTSPAWVLERFPLRVETQFFDFLRPVDVNRLVTIGSETLELRAGLRVKNPGTSINLDPQSADYLSHFSAIDFESGELLVQLQPGEHNRNQIDGQTIGEGFQFLPSLVGQGVFPTSWSPEVTGTVRIPLDDLGTTRTTVRLAESQVNNGVVTVDGDTHLQVTGLVGIDELPLARITSPRMEGKPSIKIKAGLGGLESLTEIGVAIGPGQTATIAAEVWHGNGKVEDAPITFLLIGEGSLGASSSEIKTTAGRTAANGSAFAIYHPPVAETEITSISIAAIYFLAGRSYTKSIDLPLVTTADDFRLLGDYLTPAQFAVEQSDAAAFLAAQQQALLEASEGEVNQEVRDGLQPFVDTWISQGINPALHQANVAKENYDAAVNHPGTSAMQRWQLYREAHQTTQLAATEILDLWANVALLDLEIEEPQSESIALGLRRILAASIQRGIDQFQFGVPATATTNQIDPATGSARPVPAGTPLFDAMQFANAAELLEPYSESLAQELANEQPLLRFQQIVEQAGLLSPTENAPKLVGDFNELSLTGTLGLSSTGVDLLSSGPSVLPMTIEILIDDGHRRETRTHMVNGRVVAGATANDTALLFDLPTGAIEPHQNSTHVRVELRYSIGPVDLLTQHLERYAPVSLSLTGHPATSSSSDETLTLGAASEATLHLSLRRKDSALAGETIDVRLLGGGSLSETRVQLDQNGKAQLSFTAPRFLSVNPDQPFGTTFIVASYWDEQALTTKQLRIDYELIPNLETPFDPEEYYSRDHQRASEQLAAATKSNWRLDPPTNSWDLDMTAVRTEARVILENWFTKSVDDEPSGSDPFGSVLYWLEQARDEEVDTTWTETASGQAFIRRNDEAFRESYERAVQNFDAWRTAVLGFGLDPTELVNVDQATALLKELLEKGISHQQQRARERANEYKALSSAPQTVKNEKLFQLIREGTASLEYTMEGFHRTFWDINGGQGILDELPFYIAFDPTEAANSLDFGSSLTEASLEITPRLYIREEPGQEQGEPVGLALSGMPVSVAPLDGTE
ncbi:MAG: S8 family serine peptidase, partial [Planctomycetota bacterium]